MRGGVGDCGPPTFAAVDEEATMSVDDSKELARKAMQEKLALAERLIEECVVLADEHKICFSQPSYGGYGLYTPDDRGGTDQEPTDLAWPGEFGGGWQTSDICY
jgi:hypothetical protein